MSLADRIKNKTAPRQSPPRREPLWKGPEESGITFSMLSRFLVCRERYRLYAIEGLRTADVWDHKSGYGNMWHVCEEAHAAKLNWLPALNVHCRDMRVRYPLQQSTINHWYQVCQQQFPIYIDHWGRNKDVLERTPLHQEQVFDVPYSLPSGRTVRLRGKWDAVDLIGKGKSAGIYIQENKTKGDVNELAIKRQLTFDLQTMMYLVALSNHPFCDLPRTGHYRHGGGTGKGGIVRYGGAMPGEYPILGVRYNVVRRPLSGGKGTIVRHKPSKSNPQGETEEAFYNRLAQYIKDEPDHYFMRIKAEVSQQDIATFRRQCLDPILEQLWDWWEHIEWCIAKNHDPFVSNTGIHSRHPHGCYNVLNEGGSSDYDEHLLSGSMVGLQRVEELFPELQEAQK